VRKIGLTVLAISLIGAGVIEGCRFGSGFDADVSSFLTRPDNVLGLSEMLNT
jgi:hypothetical protein